ncbi:MAG TPA: endonuclease domain-containing protein [Rhizomicrobium sp.]|jgi:very-short-patch-repair endonuclease|nr:endonuclease domain-containing protein [Rhizomicrobium sp.]
MDDQKLSPRVYARSLRKRMTNAEVILWSRLRRNAMDGHRFRRQHPIGPYVADFVCLPVRLVVELDGATHASDNERKQDARRDAYLHHRRFRVLRFWNREIYESLDGVLETIWRAVLAGQEPPG